MKNFIILFLSCCTITAGAQLSGFNTTQQNQLRLLVKLSTDSARNEAKAAITALPIIDTLNSFIYKNGVLYVNYTTVLKAIGAKADTATIKTLTTRVSTTEKNIAGKADTTSVNNVKADATIRLNSLEQWRNGITTIINSVYDVSQKIDAWIKLYTK